MAKLYGKCGGISVGGQEYLPDEEGAFDVPDEHVAALLHHGLTQVPPVAPAAEPRVETPAPVERPAAITFAVELAQAEDGRWTAQLPGFPSTVAHGMTRDAALDALSSLVTLAVAAAAPKAEVGFEVHAVDGADVQRMLARPGVKELVAEVIEASNAALAPAPKEPAPAEPSPAAPAPAEAPPAEPAPAPAAPAAPASSVQSDASPHRRRR